LLADFDAFGSLVNHLISCLGITFRRSWVDGGMLVEQTPVGQGYRSRVGGCSGEPRVSMLADFDAIGSLVDPLIGV
jgi:hypothetical protein